MRHTFRALDLLRPFKAFSGKKKKKGSQFPECITRMIMNLFGYESLS